MKGYGLIRGGVGSAPIRVQRNSPVEISQSFSISKSRVMARSSNRLAVGDGLSAQIRATALTGSMALSPLLYPYTSHSSDRQHGTIAIALSIYEPQL